MRPMAVTPSDIFDLAIKRHREPWNWTLHFVGLCGFGMTMLTHSFLFFAASLIVFGAGFFELGLPPVKEGRWLRFARACIEWEKNWVATPWNWHKTWRFVVVMGVAAVAVWALWTRDMGLLLLFLGFGYLIRVMMDNRDGGVKP